ncbi:Soluble methane monooxygenase-binding protein MmoD [Methylocella tundrae]|uniref:Soluble methane monooxygenase-binding protein MmoD n=2 Tax=Methylocella tundrae TaxID=227605 RepID=A0A8B6M8L9_METTU|nr:Soluble methane monooxygenase-binding protein MmoD [Methylocella tundrae]
MMAAILDFDHKEEDALNPSLVDRVPFAGLGTRIEIFKEGRYRAFVQDLECVWRWEIHRDDEFVQEGCSLSESSSREAVGHVISFYQRRDLGQAAKEGAQN